MPPLIRQGFEGKIPIVKFYTQYRNFSKAIRHRSLPRGGNGMDLLIASLRVKEGSASAHIRTIRSCFASRIASSGFSPIRAFACSRHGLERIHFSSLRWANRAAHGTSRPAPAGGDTLSQTFLKIAPRLIELWIVPGARHCAHVDDASSGVCLKQTDKFLEGSSGVTCRHHRCRKFLSRHALTRGVS
jgi:hypothetical protein